MNFKRKNIKKFFNKIFQVNLINLDNNYSNNKKLTYHSISFSYLCVVIIILFFYFT